jgi:AcrR family transcriptional regulator
VPTTSRGRRSRPSKPDLTLPGIVETTLALVDELGMDNVSLRRVAQELDTGPASLYVYVSDRRHLLELVHDRVLGEIELPTEADGSWRERIILLLERAVAALGRHGGIGSIGLGRIPTGPNALRVTEEMLRLLRSGGVPDQACAYGVDLLSLVVAAAGYEESLYRDLGMQEESEIARTLESFTQLDPGQFPTIAALAPVLTRGGGEERLRWAFEVLVDGLGALRAGE